MGSPLSEKLSKHFMNKIEKSIFEEIVPGKYNII